MLALALFLHLSAHNTDKEFGMDGIIIRNAAGTVKTLKEVEDMCRSAVTGITLGSITYTERSGNIGTTTGYNEKTGMYANALGLPNIGFRRYRPLLPSFAHLAHAASKELVVSIAGFTPQEYVEMAQGCFAAGVDLVELNFGCPNVWGPSGRKQMPSEDPELARAILLGVKPYLDRTGKKVSVKISPLTDMKLLSELADVILEFGCVAEVVGCNTIPDQTPLLEDGAYALAFRASEGEELKHIGGVSGTPLKVSSIQICSTLRMWLPKSIRVIGVGGIYSADDAACYLDTRAQGFECAAAHMIFGRKIYGEIARDLFN